jgi:hypothetical protein
MASLRWLSLTIEISGEKYLLWYLRAKSIKRVFEVSQKLKHPIDKFHYEVRELDSAKVAAVEERRELAAMIGSRRCSRACCPLGGMLTWRRSA